MGIQFLLVLLFAASFYAYIPHDEILVDIQKEKNIKLSCPTKSETEFVIWYKEDKSKPKDKQDVELGFSERYFFPSLSEVQIRGISAKDAGVYMCKSPFGKVQPVIKKFTVAIFDPTVIEDKPTKSQEQAPEWELIPNVNKTVDSRFPAIIPCRAIGENVVTKAYRLDLLGRKLYELPDSGVVLHKPKKDDSGKYLCTAENSMGKISHQFNVLVVVHGGISEWLAWSSCDVECGYGVQIRRRECTNPSPANGGRRCTESTTQRQRCRSRSCTSPRLVKFGFDLTGDNLVLDCHAKGIPKPTVEWRFNGERLDSTYDKNNPTMRVPKTRARSGSWSCKIRNSAGYFTMYITVDV